MEIEQEKIWQKIEEFEIDDLDSSFTFSDRLARENDWSIEYTLRAIQEYKKFIFLVTISDEPCTPSDQIDQVWHLHLLYTHSYWITLCKNTIKKDIHHGPTKGAEERDYFKEQYIRTLELYRRVFDENAPNDIWIDLDERFNNIRFTRINRHKYWVFPKPTFLQK